MGLVVVAASMYVLNPFSYLVLTSGLILSLLGLGEVCLVLFQDWNPTHQVKAVNAYFEQRQNLLKDNRGVAYIWAVVIIGIIFVPFTYQLIGQAWSAVFDWAFGIRAWDGTLLSAFTLTRVIVSFLPTFALFGFIFYAVVNAKASAYEG